MMGDGEREVLQEGNNYVSVQGGLYEMGAHILMRDGVEGTSRREWCYARRTG